jgi:hypothetical protein
MKFPSVKKAFGRIVSSERIGRKTVKFVGAALFAAGLAAAGTSGSKADVGQLMVQSVQLGGVIVIPVAPSISLTDGSIVVADHYSHSSHVSHASHCSSAGTYCP